MFMKNRKRMNISCLCRIAKNVQRKSGAISHVRMNERTPLMQDQEGLYASESVWPLKPKSLTEVLDEALPPVWRDEKTGLPMHSHGVVVTNDNDGFEILMPSSKPCPCGRTVFDVPLANERRTHSMKPTRLFKGPLFPSKAKRPQPLNAADPVGRGVIDEEDFTNREAGRPTRKDLEMQRKSKEDHRGE